MDTVNQMNDFFTTRAKSNNWAMVVLYYIPDTTRVNSKELWCMKNKIDIHKHKTFDFTWELTNELCVQQVSCRTTNGLSKMVQLKIQMFLGRALDAPIPKPRVERRYYPNGKRKKYCIHLQNCQTKSEKDKAPQSKEQCQSCGESICQDLSIRLCHHCLESRNTTVINN